MFGGGRYASMTGKVGERDAVFYDEKRRMEVPVSDIQRDASVIS